MYTQLELKETYKNEKEDLEKQVTYFKTRMEEAEENSRQAANDSAKEMDSLKVRLEMAKEEYKILYKELRSLEGKDHKGSNKEGTSPVKEKMLGTTSVVEGEHRGDSLITTDSSSPFVLLKFIYLDNLNDWVG